MAYNLFERWYRDTRKKIVKVEGAPQKNTITPYTDPYSECDYIPANGDSPIIETVPGTHATADLLAHLVFNRFFLDTPVYREKYRLMKERMRVSRQTDRTGFSKGLTSSSP